MRVIGFLIGFGVAFGGVMIFMYFAGLRPRGPFWLIVAISAGMWGSRVFPNLAKRYSDGTLKVEFNEKIDGYSNTKKTLLLLSIGWSLVVFLYVFLFEPYGYRMYKSDTYHMLKVIAFPIAVLWGFSWAYKKFIDKK